MEAQFKLQPQEEFCPSCGKFVEPSHFNYDLGWCLDCAPNARNAHAKFLEEHADHIEHYIASGFSLATSIFKVRAEIRPSCVVCGNAIKHGSKASMFCHKNKLCRYYARRYKHFYTRTYLTKTQAFAKILKEITGEDDE